MASSIPPLIPAPERDIRRKIRHAGLVTQALRLSYQYCASTLPLGLAMLSEQQALPPRTCYQMHNSRLWIQSECESRLLQRGEARALLDELLHEHGAAYWTKTFSPPKHPVAAAPSFPAHTRVVPVATPNHQWPLCLTSHH